MLVVVPLTRLHPEVFCLDVSLPIVFILVAFQHWLLVWVDVSCFVALSCSYSLPLSHTRACSDIDFFNLGRWRWVLGVGVVVAVGDWCGMSIGFLVQLFVG